MEKPSMGKDKGLYNYLKIDDFLSHGEKNLNV